jgi:hypothetical protein
MGGAGNTAAPKEWRDIAFGPPAGAMMAGTLEIAFFHPFDTVAKRLMSHKQRVVLPSDPAQTWRNVKSVVFKGLPEEGRTMAGRVAHMYPGSKWAITYKVSQRVVKFAGQPLVRDSLYRSGSDRYFTDALGAKWGKPCLEACAGTFVGVCEVVLLPFDRMKVLAQTNKDAVAGRGFADIIRKEGIGAMYAGASTTAVRNAPGSFLLFFGACTTKDVVFGLEDYRSATFFQNTVAGTVGACAGVIFTSPMDVVKTRIQSQGFSGGGGAGAANKSGLGIVADVIRAEGVSAFYKGITPKLVTSAPKLIFSYTMTEYFVKKLSAFRNSK